MQLHHDRNTQETILGTENNKTLKKKKKKAAQSWSASRSHRKRSWVEHRGSLCYCSFPCPALLGAQPRPGPDPAASESGKQSKALEMCIQFLAVSKLSCHLEYVLYLSFFTISICKLERTHFNSS